MKSAEEKAREDMRRDQDIACAHDICVALKEMEEEYDERTCITAGELRTMGVNVPKSVPDCGWVSRASVTIGPMKAGHGDEPGAIKVTADVKITEPFSWVSVDIALKPEEP